MRQQSAARPHTPSGDVLSTRPLPPTPASGAATGAGASGRFATLLEQAAHEILAVTYWFEPAQRPQPYPVTVRYVGRRVGVTGKYQPGDQFVHDETIAQVVPGSGPIALTARIGGINPCEWLVTAHQLGSSEARPATRQARRWRQATVSPVAVAVAAPHGPVARFWRRWAPPTASTEASATPIRTTPPPFVHVAGTLALIWLSMVTLGMVLAVLLQSQVVSRAHVALRPVWTVALATIAVGIVGAKVWFVVKHRSDHRYDGWCIQGLIVGASLGAAILLALARMPVGVYLDGTAPGLLLGLAVGRVGCFFAGCCGGPPTASRWGVWSSDQHVGARRIPTQLMEAALVLGLGLGALVELLSHSTAGGAFSLGDWRPTPWVGRASCTCAPSHRSPRWAGGPRWPRPRSCLRSVSRCSSSVTCV
jgi:phosphatidylglycerol:prolipoprotein diacylglycerol transferase